MRFSIALVTACTAFTCNAASPPDTCDGLWKGHYIDSARGWDTDVDMAIAEDKGEWIARLGHHKQRNSPCRNVGFPVTVMRCTDTEFNFHVDGGKIAGCPTFTARLLRKDADTAEGAKGGGEKPLRMIRQQEAPKR